MSKKVLIIGSSRGIGLGLAKIYHQKGFQVIGTCRDPSDDLKKVSKDILTNIDSLNKDTPKLIYAYLKENNHLELDTVIYNSGILDLDLNMKKIGEFEQSDMENFEKHMQINCFAPTFIFNEFVKQKLKMKKVSVISTRMACINEAGGKFYPYRISKIAVNMAFKCMSQDLKEEGIPVAILHPGMVNTEMIQKIDNPQKIEVETSVTGLYDRIEKDLTIETTGSFWHQNGDILQW